MRYFFSLLVQHNTNQREELSTSRFFLLLEEEQRQLAQSPLLQSNYLFFNTTHFKDKQARVQHTMIQVCGCSTVTVRGCIKKKKGIINPGLEWASLEERHFGFANKVRVLFVRASIKTCQKQMTHNNKENKSRHHRGEWGMGLAWCVVIKMTKEGPVCRCCVCGCVPSKYFGLGRQLFCLIPTDPRLFAQVRWHKESFVLLL